MLEFLTSGTFLVIMEIVVIASLGAVLIWRIKKNNQAAEKRRDLRRTISHKQAKPPAMKEE